MSSTGLVSSTKKQQNPAEILRLQYDVLTKLYQETKIQNEILRAPMSGLDNSIVKHQVRVKIEDVNMPFTAMVGLMIKIALASIPALIILMIIFSMIFGLFWLVFIGLIAGIFS